MKSLFVVPLTAAFTGMALKSACIQNRDKRIAQ